MNILNLFLIITVFTICICRTLVNAINVLVKVKSQNHHIFYNVREVEFSDVDVYNIMYHANYVKHTGNALIKYMFLLNKNINNKPLYVVKNINVTHMKPLKFQDKYKIIGTITNYGHTSLQITIAGVSHFNKTPENLRRMFKTLKKNDLGLFLQDKQTNGIDENKEIVETHPETEQEKIIEQEAVEKIERGKLHAMDVEVTSTEKIYESTIAKNQQEETKTLNKSFRGLGNGQPNEENCVVYFTGVFTLVYINGNEQKQPVPENMKKAYPPMDKQDFEKIVKFLC